MGFEPARIPYIHESAKILGNGAVEHIDQAGESLRTPETPFAVVPEFRYLVAA
jgi:hypothetical protein